MLRGNLNVMTFKNFTLYVSIVCLFSDYCASKFAAFGFAESVFMETFAKKQNGIKTTIVCPFFINTGMFDGCTTG